MIRDDVVRWAREAGFEELFKDSHDWVCFTEEIERFAALVSAAEKNRLADAIEKMPFGDTAASFAVFVRNFK